MARAVDNVIEVPGALILGAGVAGLFTALKLAPFSSLVLAGTRPGSSGSSAWAQGGIAAAMSPHDSWHAHAADTISAGAGTCDVDVVKFVTREACDRIEDLVRLGVPFDRNADGTLALGREAAHAANRIVHAAGDRVGAEVTRTLALRALNTPSIRILEGYHAVELAMENGRVAGLFARVGLGVEARLVLFRAPTVIFATGGLGSLYAVTTNPPESRGEGVGMAARAGAVIADAEFVQFHPTAIAIGRDPAPLATEALRGEGATLVDETGVRFMASVHPDCELAPRDVVARAIYREMARGHRVFLDCRTAIGAQFERRFPTVHAACKEGCVDPVKQPIPIAPAAHYHMGGIATDAYGRTSLEGLWAVGECASTGLHGANRLASNSLLEALVFGARAAQDIEGLMAHRAVPQMPLAPGLFAPMPSPHVLRDAMTRFVGLERDHDGLIKMLDVIAGIERAGAPDPALLNLAATAKLVTAAALFRHESRGAHFRSDYPRIDEMGARSFLTLADAERISHEAGATTEQACRARA